MKITEQGLRQWEKTSSLKKTLFTSLADILLTWSVPYLWVGELVDGAFGVLKVKTVGGIVSSGMATRKSAGNDIKTLETVH